MKEKEEMVDKLIDNYILRGYSKVTIRNYCSIIKRFLKYFEETEVKDLLEEELLEYLKETILEEGLTTKTYNCHVSVLRYFYLLLFDRSLNSVRLPLCKCENKITTIVSREVLLTMIRETTNIKHKAWLCLAYGSGLRLSEVATLKIENILSRERKLKIFGKGRKERFTILPDFTLQILREYYFLELFGEKNGYLFKGCKDNHHISPINIMKFFKRINQKYNLPVEFTFHSLRHCFATHYIMDGGEPFTLKALLGHSSMKSTAIYVNLARDFKTIHSPLDGDYNG